MKAKFALVKVHPQTISPVVFFKKQKKALTLLEKLHVFAKIG
jgi:hypothetical protein